MEKCEFVLFVVQKKFANASLIASLHSMIIINPFIPAETSWKAAEQPDANIVLALAEQNRIIGYGVLGYPDRGERWADLGPEIMMEVRAIEVCRSWRSHKIASSILKMLVVHPQIEEKIVYMVGYFWTWDLNGT